LQASSRHAIRTMKETGMSAGTDGLVVGHRVSTSDGQPPEGAIIHCAEVASPRRVQSGEDVSGTFKPERLS
jgi:hypothetical protein